MTYASTALLLQLVEFFKDLVQKVVREIFEIAHV